MIVAALHICPLLCCQLIEGRSADEGRARVHPGVGNGTTLAAGPYTGPTPPSQPSTSLAFAACGAAPPACVNQSDQAAALHFAPVLQRRSAGSTWVQVCSTAPRCQQQEMMVLPSNLPTVQREVDAMTAETHLRIC